MTPKKRHLAPRHVFVVAGLVVVALTALGDRHLLDLPRVIGSVDDFFYGFYEEGGLEEEFAPLTPEIAGVQALRKAMAKLEKAGEAFSDGFKDKSNWQEDPPVLGTEEYDPANLVELMDEDAFYDPEFLDENDAWPIYWKARDKLWPAYAAALEACIVEVRAAQELDPGNGAFEAMAGLLELDLCMRPSAVDPVFDMDLDVARGVARLQITDPERLERALQAIELGLGHEEFTFRDSAVMKARADRFAHVPSLKGAAQQLSQAATVLMPELMNLKAHVLALTYVAHKSRRGGESGERPLRLGRKVALRSGAEATSLIGLLVAIAELNRVDSAWLRETAAASDVEGTLAAHAEVRVMQRHRESARRLNRTEVFRLGVFDSLLTPAGGWGTDKPDFATNRLLDYAFVESAILWGLILLAAFYLLLMAWNARAKVEPGVVTAAGFTLGDLLGVVLPSFVGAAVLALIFSRLHPMRELGLTAGRGKMILVVGLQAGFFLTLGVAGFAVLLRRSALAKHGLPLRRPALAGWGVGCIALGCFLGLFWVGPYALGVAPAAVGLVFLGIVLGAFSGLGAKPHADPQVTKGIERFEGRVGLACLGATLCLLGAVEAVFVTPRREALTERYRNLALERFYGEAEHWGGGEPQKQFKDWLLEAPERPTRPGSGQ